MTSGPGPQPRRWFAGTRRLEQGLGCPSRSGPTANLVLDYVGQSHACFADLGFSQPDLVLDLNAMPKTIRAADAQVQHEYSQAVKMTKEAVLYRARVIAGWHQRFRRTKGKFE